jgi:hypothetical protein
MADAPKHVPADDEGPDRPSMHGAILGDALASIAAEGFKRLPELQPDPPEMCATCAFRPGSVPNRSAGTGMIALNCVLRIDPDRFACHHGMHGGEPTKLCAGYLASKLVPWDFVKQTVLELNERLQTMSGPDEIRAAFDAWYAEADPLREMDAYQLARAYLKAVRGSHG